MNVLRDAYSVLWADLRIMRHLWLRFLITSLMSPLLYLIAFGYGLGRNMTIDGSDYLDFVIPGIIALTAMNTSFNSAGFKLNVDRLFFRSFDEMLMSPISTVSLVLGKSMIGVMRGLIISLLFMIIGLAVSSINITPLFILTLLLTCLMFSLLGVLCAMYVKSHQDMATFTSVILIPMTFLGGTFFAMSQVPRWMEGIFYILPLTHSSSCLRAEALGNSYPWVSLSILAGLTILFFGLCIRAVRRSSI